MTRLIPALVLLIPGAAHAACPSASTPADVHARLGSAEEALAAAEVAAFQSSVDEVTLLVPCLGERADVGLAVRVHRLEGVKRYIGGDTAGADPSLLAARGLDAAYVFPDDLFPPGHDLRVRYEAFAAEPGPTRAVAPPKEGELYFDGQATVRRPLDRATLLQLTDAQGAVRETLYLDPGEPMPSYPGRTPRRNRLLIATGATAAGAVASYGMALSTQRQFWSDSPQTKDDLEALKGRANTLVGVAGVLGAATVGGGVAVVITGPR